MKKNILWFCLGILFLGITIILILPIAFPYLFGDPGIDYLCNMGYGDGVKDSYVLVESDVSKFDQNEDIRLQISTGFFDSLSAAQSATAVRFSFVENAVFDLSVDCGEEYELSSDLLQNGEFKYQTTAYKVMLHEGAVPREDLVLNRKGLFQTVRKDSLNYSFDLILTIKEDAPETATGTLHFFISCGSKVNQCMINYYKDGNCIYFSGEDDPKEVAKKLG